MEGFTYPVQVSCENHEGPGLVALQQWDAINKKWNMVTDFYEPMRDIVAPLIAEDSAKFAKENNITPRNCD